MTESRKYRALIVALFVALAASFSLLPLSGGETKALTAGTAYVSSDRALPTQEQQEEQPAEQATPEEDGERKAWAATAVALFLAITGVGFLLAVYGYSSSR